MAVSVTSVGTAFTTTGATSITLTTTGAVPAGALLYVGGTDRATVNTTRTVSDSASNTYTRAAFTYFNNSFTQGCANIFYSENSSAVASGGTITYTCTASAVMTLAAAYATGIVSSSPLDVTGTAASSSTTVTGTSPAPSTSGNLVVAFSGIRTGVSTITPDGTPWVNTPGVIIPGAPSTVTAVAQYYVEAGTATEAYSVTSSTSQVWGLVFASFKAIPATALNGDFFLLFD